MPVIWTRLLYCISAFNPITAVLFNDYTIEFLHVTEFKTISKKVFFFAKFRPRVTFAIGAALRALQLCTPIQLVFDPTMGIGFGLNVICLFAKSVWPATIVLGWACTKPMWKILGACPPSYRPVPITISLSKSLDKSSSSTADDTSQGYRLGI